MPHPHGEPLLTHVSTGAHLTLTGRSGSVSPGVTAPFPQVLEHEKFCFCPPKVKSFSQYCGSPVTKSHWPSKSDSLEIPSPFIGSPGWEAWCHMKNPQNRRMYSLVLFCSRLWVTHPEEMKFDFIMIMHFLPTRYRLFFIFGHGLSVFWWIPVSSCWLLFNSHLQFWCSLRRVWEYILLLYHLDPEAWRRLLESLGLQGDQSSQS